MKVGILVRDAGIGFPAGMADSMVESRGEPHERTPMEEGYPGLPSLRPPSVSSAGPIPCKQEIPSSLGLLWCRWVRTTSWPNYGPTPQRRRHSIRRHALHAAHAGIATPAHDHYAPKQYPSRLICASYLQGAAGSHLKRGNCQVPRSRQTAPCETTVANFQQPWCELSAQGERITLHIIGLARSSGEAEWPQKHGISRSLSEAKLRSRFEQPVIQEVAPAAAWRMLSDSSLPRHA